MELGRLHVITDTRPGRHPLALVRAALEAGAPTIQVRSEGATDRAFFELVEGVRALCVEHGAACIVNDRLDLALAAGADGVHLGADDLPIEAARRVGGGELWVGATARHPQAARELVEEGADYLGVGPAYATSTKPSLPGPLGPEGVAAIAEAVEVPVIAIGGITVARVGELIRAGAHGVAVVSAVSEAPDPAQAVRELLEALAAHAGRGQGTGERR